MDMKSVARHLFATMDRQDWAMIERELVAPEVKSIAGGQELDFAGWREMGNLFYGAFPDGRHRIDDVICEGDKVVVRARFEGTNDGSFMGIPPTGKKISITMIMIDRFDSKGRVVEHWGDFDSAGLLRQLGVLPG